MRRPDVDGLSLAGARFGGVPYSGDIAFWASGIIMSLAIGESAASTTSGRAGRSCGPAHCFGDVWSGRVAVHRSDAAARLRQPVAAGDGNSGPGAKVGGR